VENLILNPEAEASDHTTLRVAGMDCADEVAALERALKPVKGIKEVKVSLMAGTVNISHDSTLTDADLIKAVGTAGLKASVPEEDRGNEASEGAQRRRLIAVVISGVFTGVGLLLQWTKVLEPWGKVGACAAAIVAGGWFILPKAIRAARRFALDMNVLMTVAVVGAAAIDQWSEGASVAFLFALSELLEAFSLNRARKAVKSLLDLSPETALRKEGNDFREVLVDQVKVDDIVAAKSGMKVPLDGVITVGESSINQAKITGESMPVEKKPGDQVFAGTINGGNDARSHHSSRRGSAVAKGAIATIR
jgi:Cd2+/Zn2+-exporting ATPase